MFQGKDIELSSMYYGYFTSEIHLRFQICQLLLFVLETDKVIAYTFLFGVTCSFFIFYLTFS